MLLAPLALAMPVAGDAYEASLVQAGLTRVMTLDRDEPVHTQLRPTLPGSLLGVDEDFRSDTSLKAGSTTTLGWTYTRFVSDRLALRLEAGVPSKVELSGAGIVAATGPSGAVFRIDLGEPSNNPLGSALQWSPALVAVLRLGSPGASYRPYLALGARYTWFTHVDLDDTLQAQVQQRAAQPLASAAGIPGPTTLQARAAPTLDPQVSVGVLRRLQGHWGWSASLSYSPLKTTSSVEARAADGSRLFRSSSEVTGNVLIAALAADFWY